MIFSLVQQTDVSGRMTPVRHHVFTGPVSLLVRGEQLPVIVSQAGAQLHQGLRLHVIKVSWEPFDSGTNGNKETIRKH